MNAIPMSVGLFREDILKLIMHGIRVPGHADCSDNGHPYEPLITARAGSTALLSNLVWVV